MVLEITRCLEEVMGSTPINSIFCFFWFFFLVREGMGDVTMLLGNRTGVSVSVSGIR